MLSTGSKVIDCTSGAVYLGTPMLLPVYDTKRNIIGMSQVPKNLPLLSIKADIQKGKPGRCTTACKNLQTALKDSESERDY